jgi:AraC family transcriptional regulator, dual regulator of chb operon
MDIKALDDKLRSLNAMEQRLKVAHEVQLKDFFSTETSMNHWRINSAKLMLPSEDIAIHKHDRFTKFDEHNHDYIEMMFVYSGTIVHHFEDEVIRLNKGEILLLDMKVSHSIELAQEEDIAINIMIKKEFFDTFFMQQIAYNDVISNFVIKAVYENSWESKLPNSKASFGGYEDQAYVYFKTGENEHIWSLMIHLLLEYYDRRNGMDTAIKAYMLLIFNELFRDYEKYMDTHLVHRIEKTIVGEIVTYINQHYKTATLKDMSTYFNYSTDHLGKQIKKLTGKSIKDLIIERRFEQAIYLLEHTEMPILELIAEVGYSNVTYFYKQFKEIYGSTPDEYRKNYGKG